MFKWIALLLLIASPALADPPSYFANQEKKSATKWSLAEWYDAKNKMAIQDMFLALHTPTPYEFILGGDYFFGDTAKGSPSGSRFVAAAYATLFGLQIEREMLDGFRNTWIGAFEVRVFGVQNQGTNLTVEGGLRDAGGYRNPLAGVNLTIYFARFFGVQGSFRNFFDSTPGPGSAVYSGKRWEAQGFIDFRLLRVGGGYFSESGSASINGAFAGVKFFY